MPLPRPVWLLGWVSFFTDTASEMIYPLMPLFLTRVLGAGPMSLGVIEGVAEAANSILKIVSGRLADRTGAPKPLVLAGYGLSSIVRPFIAVAGGWLQVLALRFADRLGKGIRSSPRDAMLATFATESNRGQIFGFHRGMDHAGAVMGPLIAAAFLYFRPDDYRTLFALTIVPGIIVILILLRLPATRRETSSTPTSRLPTPSRHGATTFGEDHRLPRAFWHAMALIFLFSLGNASDAFLLLRFADVGIAPFWIPLLWSAIHVVKTASSMIGGRISDRMGRPQVIGIGWLLYAGVYAAFAITDSAAALVVVFLVYGLYFGLTEGVEKAWVADLAPVAARGNAFGIYNALIGFGALGASLLFGYIWTHVSPPAAFYTGAGFALVATGLLYLTVSSSGGGEDGGNGSQERSSGANEENQEERPQSTGCDAAGAGLSARTEWTREIRNHKLLQPAVSLCLWISRIHSRAERAQRRRFWRSHVFSVGSVAPFLDPLPPSPPSSSVPGSRT